MVESLECFGGEGAVTFYVKINNINSNAIMSLNNNNNNNFCRVQRELNLGCWLCRFWKTKNPKRNKEKRSSNNHRKLLLENRE